MPYEFFYSELNFEKKNQFTHSLSVMDHLYDKRIAKKYTKYNSSSLRAWKTKH